MATVREMMQDAAASIETSSTMSVGDMFMGSTNNAAGDTEDWVAVELEEGKTYSISLTGEPGDDPILTLYGPKGGFIDMHDDINPAGSDRPGDATNLNSMLSFRAEDDGTYYISAGNFRGNPNDDNSGAYTIEVVEVPIPGDLIGTDDADKLTGTDAGEEISGEGGDDTIDGRGGDDEIDGGDGNDLITGGPGADIIMGGDHTHDDNDVGGDTVSYKYSAEGVDINLRAGSASGGDADGDMLGTDVENVIGSMHDDVLSGSRGVNSLWGLGGNDELFGDKRGDKLYGGDGDDTLDGGDGDDTLEGGPGADMLTGGDDEDTASYASSMMGVTVRLRAGHVKGGDGDGDVFVDQVTVEYDNPDPEAEDDEKVLEETVPDFVNVTGSNNADVLAGDSRDNVLMGLGGDDKLFGGPGGGDDLLDGGAGADMVFGGIGNDTLHGGSGDDILTGGAGRDKYFGGPGSDMIHADDADRPISGASEVTTPLLLNLMKETMIRWVTTPYLMRG